MAKLKSGAAAAGAAPLTSFFRKLGGPDTGQSHAVDISPRSFSPSRDNRGNLHRPIAPARLFQWHDVCWHRPVCM